MNVAHAIDPARLRRHLVQGAVCASLATVLVMVLSTSRSTLAQVREFPLGVLPLLLSMVVFSWSCNATRIRLMAGAVGHRLGRRQVFTITLVMELGINTTPAGVGGSVLRLSLLHRAGVPLSTASGLLAQGVLMDTLVMVPVGVAGLLVLLDRRLPSVAVERTFTLDTAVALATLVALLLAVARLSRSPRAQRALERGVNAVVPGRRLRLAARLRHTRRVLPGGWRRARATVVLLWRERKAALFADGLLATLQHGSRYLVLPVIIWSFGIAANPLELFAGQGLLFALSLLVVLPGGGGSVELLSAVLLPGIVPVGIVGVVVVLWRFFTYHVYLIAGAAALCALTRRNIYPFHPVRSPETRADEPAVAHRRRPISAAQTTSGRYHDDGNACDAPQTPTR
jgi:uncharacterized protein (TIRG00374 family)